MARVCLCACACRQCARAFCDWERSGSQNIFRLPCKPYAGRGDCTAAQLAMITQYRTDTLNALAPVLQNPIHGGFYTACVQVRGDRAGCRLRARRVAPTLVFCAAGVQHCHSNIDFCFDDEIVQGQSMGTTLYAFWASTVLKRPPPAGVATTVIDGPGLSNPTCTATCSPY